jgi:hypothetical protein
VSYFKTAEEALLKPQLIQSIYSLFTCIEPKEMGTGQVSAIIFPVFWKNKKAISLYSRKYTNH